MGDPVDWKLAERVAARVSGTEPFAESYHAAGLVRDFAELTERAQEHVEAETGLRSAAGPARARVVGRDEWVRANLASYRRLLRPVLERLEEVAKGPAGLLSGKVAAVELGGLLGWMSTRVLGQYDLLVLEDEDPEDQDLVYYVGPNILALEKRHSFPPEEFRLWVALHEVTHRTQFTGVPWLRHYFLGLVEELMGAVEPDPKRLFTAAGRIAEAVRTGRNPLDEGGVVALFATQAQRDAIERVGGLMSLLEGHGDVTMDRAAADQVPSAARFARVLRTRRKEANLAAKLLQRLIGLEAKLAQYEQGERFIEVVEGVGGPALLNRVFERPEHLPTLTEIREPQRWLDRIERSAA
ncbi:MAG TPA: zinc-dependent metalloprotease [Microthrixaceae bacterium]|nr:zinc-dependent metalloprotease [Microthrixaceae bacterium]